MKRDWLRLQRAQGLKPWLFPILAVLLVAALWWMSVPETLDRRRSAGDSDPDEGSDAVGGSDGDGAQKQLP